MQKRLLTRVLMVILLLLVVVPAAVTAAPLLDWSANSSDMVEVQLPAAQAGEEDKPKLATASVVAQLANQPGRTLVTARANHFVVDSPPLLGGPNEEINPMDLLLGALASCSTFVYEMTAQEMGIPLEQVMATVEADFDPRGVKGEPVDPRIQAFRVHMAVVGPTEEQAKSLADQFRQRCPIYTTLSRAAPIEIETTIEEAMAAEKEAEGSNISQLPSSIEALAGIWSRPKAGYPEPGKFLWQLNPDGTDLVFQEDTVAGKVVRTESAEVPHGEWWFQGTELHVRFPRNSDTPDPWGCDVIGKYRLHPAERGDILFEPVEDSCSPRRVFFSGEVWQRATLTPEPPSATEGKPASDPLAVGNPERGREIFETGGGVISAENRCSGCHSLDGTVKEYISAGPSFQGIAERAGNRVPGLSVVEYLRQSIVDPSAYVVKGFSDNKMPKAYSIFLSEEEIDDVIAFLLTQ
jgi:putative redox protein